MKEKGINTVIVDDYYDNEIEVICKEVLFKILDKYKNQEVKYKNAYEDLRFMVIDDYFHRVQELEQKHGIKE